MADKNKDDGGPAFPCDGMGQRDFGDPGAYAGMTLRDYFAAKAMAAYIQADIEGAASRPNAAAQWAYESADAMLAERSKP